jgi:general secretion pathway protein D
MRCAFSIAVFCFLAVVPGFAGIDSSVEPPAISCGNGVPGGVSCIPSKEDLKEARTAYSHGVKLQDRQRLEEAFAKFDEASRLAPEDRQFFSAREMVKSQLVFQHTERGESLLAGAQQEPAVAEFRAALQLDPDNEYIQQRLTEAMRAPVEKSLGDMPFLVGNSIEIHLDPKDGRATFHYLGDVRTLFAELASAYGMTAQFDDSVEPRTVQFNVDDVDFFTALELACRVSKTMWTALDSHQLLIAKDSTENHKQFDRLSLATFTVPGASTPQEATAMVTSLRNICDFQKINTGQAGTVEVRAPQPILHACTTLLSQLNSQKPAVVFDLEVYDVNHNLTRNIGVHIPNTFNLYNIPAIALAGLGGQSIQSLINQLISSGGINAAGNSTLSGLLAQLQSQQNSIFSNPLATFGGGLTFMGLSLDQFAAALSLNESWARSLSRVTLRAEQGNEATFHVGERYPILNGSYAPISNSSAISAVLGNQSYVAPFPSVSYEDLGLSVKAKPTIQRDGDVSLTLDLEVRSLTGQSANGVPVLSNQEYHGSIRLRDGEPAVIAGEISTSDIKAMTGIPGLGAIPLLNQAMVNNSLTKEDDELLIILTPHVVANHSRDTEEIWVSGSN